MNENKFSITRSNLKNMVYHANVKIDAEISDIYKSLYEAVDLKNYINEGEALSIYKVIKFLELSEDAILKIKDSIESGEDKNKKGKNEKNLLFPKSAPRYHKSSDCKTLLSDFENFEIPFEIMQRGFNDIEKFKRFGNLNRSLISKGKVDLFIYKLKNEFNLSSDIREVHIINSGRIDISKDPQDEVTNKIIQTIYNIEEFRETEEGLSAIEDYIYSPIKNIKSSSISKKGVELLSQKRILLELIMQFNLNKYREENKGETFSEKLLEFYGFKKCSVCLKDEIGFDIYD